MAVFLANRESAEVIRASAYVSVETLLVLVVLKEFEEERSESLWIAFHERDHF